MTLNVAHGRGLAFMQSRARKRSFFARNLDVIAALIQRERPHVVALQEAELGSRWAADFDHVAYLSERSGLPHVVAHGHMSTDRLRYGTALLSSLPFVDSGGARFVKQHARWLKGYSWITLDSPRIAVASVHLDFRAHATRVAQAKELIAAARSLELPIVIAGDLNETKPPQTGYVRPDCGRAEPTDRWGTRPIDWILVSAGLRCRALRTLPDRVSDHRAVVADIEMT